MSLFQDSVNPFGDDLERLKQDIKEELERKIKQDLREEFKKELKQGKEEIRAEMFDLLPHASSVKAIDNMNAETCMSPEYSN